MTTEAAYPAYFTASAAPSRKLKINYGGEGMLLDIDTRIGISTLHDLRCSTAMTAHSTATKPFGRLGADGGWFPVVDRTHALEKVATWSPGLELADCPACLAPKATSVLDLAEN